MVSHFAEVAGNILTDVLVERYRSPRLNFHFTEFNEFASPRHAAILPQEVVLRQWWQRTSST